MASNGTSLLSRVSSREVEVMSRNSLLKASNKPTSVLGRWSRPLLRGRGRALPWLHRGKELWLWLLHPYVCSQLLSSVLSSQKVCERAPTAGAYVTPQNPVYSSLEFSTKEGPNFLQIYCLGRKNGGTLKFQPCLLPARRDLYRSFFNSAKNTICR